MQRRRICFGPVTGCRLLPLLLSLAAAFLVDAAIAQDREGAPPIAPAASSAPPHSALLNNFRAVTDAMLRSPEAADWLMWRRTWDAWGYSPLKRITVSNVSRLQLAWARELATPGKQEGTPLEHDGMLFMPEPNDVIRAFDAKSGEVIWEYKRKIPDDVKNYIPNLDAKRNIAIWGNYIIDTSGDDYLFALDAKTGKLAWETQITDYKVHPAQQTAGPIVANGKVFSGRGCEPRGGPEACFFTAHDATTGKELWRFYTVPRPGEAGYDTWGDVPYEGRWHVGTWQAPSYDAGLNIVYVGTSVTSPGPKFALGGNDHDYLYNNSTLALDGDTGKLLWHFQYVVDHWDMDHTFERILLDTRVAPDPGAVRWINPKLKRGERRKVITGIPGKSGIVYTLDRQTGEFLWATETVKQTLIQDIDLDSGRSTINPEAIFTAVGQTRLICPSTQGGKNWMAGAYSPLTETMYFPLQNACTQMTAVLDKPSLQSLYGTRLRAALIEGETNLGTIRAVSAITGKTQWIYKQRAGTLSLLTTGGGLLFGGDSAGNFRAFDQKTGKVLWQTNLGAPVTGYPISFETGGKQYVVATTGTSISTASWNALTPDVKTGASNMIFVFVLN